MTLRKKITTVFGVTASLFALSLAPLVFAQDDANETANDDFVADAEEQVTEEEDIRTVDEIQALINLPAGARLTPFREADEDLENPVSIFDDPDRVRQLLGERPRFIYYAEGVDPMIIPWVRAQVVAQQLQEDAEAAERAGDWESARAVYERIRTEFPNTDQGQAAAQNVRRVERRIEMAMLGETEPEPVEPEDVVFEDPTAQRVELPTWIRTNTTGVFAFSDRSIVIVGDEFLQVGDVVPGYPAVTLAKVEPSLVTYRFQDRDFEVKIDPTE